MSQHDEPLEIIEDEGGPGVGADFGIIIATSVLLLGGVILIMLALGSHYARGPFGGA